MTHAGVDLKLEVAVIPVADVERSKEFYASLGWRLDADFVRNDGSRAVQFTPPGSPCSIHLVDLLSDVLAAHGGLDHWNSFEKASVTIVSGGELWGMKGIEADATPRRVTAAIHHEWMDVAPYGDPDWRMTFVPERVVIEAPDNKIIAERDNPLAAFAGHTLNTPWDPLHRAYFNGYAMWTYLNTPFLMALPGFKVEEIAPWNEEGETWRVLRATFPKEIESHCPVQEFYFGPDFLLRRHDYQVDISGSFPAAQYVYDMVTADGIRFPTKRRAHPRSADGRPDRDRVYVWIDLTDFGMS